jgi:uncharacterized membrane protein
MNGAALVLNMACMARDFVNVFDKVTAVEFVVENDVVTMVIKRPLNDRIVAIHKIYSVHILIGSPSVDCG